MKALVYDQEAHKIFIYLKKFIFFLFPNLHCPLLNSFALSNVINSLRILLLKMANKLEPRYNTNVSITLLLLTFL